MKTSIISILSLGLFRLTASAFTATLEIGIGQLRDSGGNLVQPNSTWALIVSNSAGGLPGGLTDGGPIGTIPQIVADFNGVSLTDGNKGGYTIIQTGLVSGAYLGFPATVDESILFDFPFSGPPSPPIIPGTLLGVYWFPNSSPGTTLTGIYEVGGFAQSIANPQSGGSSGTIIPNPGELQFAYFFETTFNQDGLMGGSTELGAERFTAVAVPEISPLTISAIGLGGLLMRRRR